MPNREVTPTPTLSLKLEKHSTMVFSLISTIKVPKPSSNVSKFHFNRQFFLIPILYWLIQTLASPSMFPLLHR